MCVLSTSDCLSTLGRSFACEATAKWPLSSLCLTSDTRNWAWPWPLYYSIYYYKRAAQLFLFSEKLHYKLSTWWKWIINRQWGKCNGNEEYDSVSLSSKNENSERWSGARQTIDQVLAMTNWWQCKVKQWARLHKENWKWMGSESGPSVCWP